MAAPFPVEVQVQEVRRDVDIDEILAEAVRSFPVLYNKSLKEFLHFYHDCETSTVMKSIGYILD